MNRAYVITKISPDLNLAISVKSSKPLALNACTDELGPDGTWVSKEKHTGEYKLGETSVFYKMFMVNK